MSVAGNFPGDWPVTFSLETEPKEHRKTKNNWQLAVYVFMDREVKAHMPLEFRIRGTPGTKYGIMLGTTDGNAVETPKRGSKYKDIYNQRLFVLEVTIPEAGECKFSLDHCESSSQHNKKPFQYLAVQLDDNGDLPLNDREEFVRYETTLRSDPFWMESRDSKPGELNEIVLPFPRGHLQGVSIKKAFLTLAHRVVKPIAPDEEIRKLKKQMKRLKMQIKHYVLKRCDECAANSNPSYHCNKKCKRVEVSEQVGVEEDPAEYVEEAGASDDQDVLEALLHFLPSPSLSSSSSQMSEHVDPRGEGLEETSGKDLTEVSKPVDVEEAGARPFSSASSLQMSEEDIDQTGRGPGDASRKRSYSEINQTEEAKAAVELQEIEELRCDECAAQSDPSYHYSEKCQRVEVSEQVGVEEDPAEYVEEAGEGLEETSRKRPHDEMADNEAKTELEKHEAFSEGEWKRLFPQCASSPTSGPSSASVPEGGNSTEGDRNGIGSPQSSSSKKYSSNVEGNFPAYPQNFSSEPADKEDLDSFALFPSL